MFQKKIFLVFATLFWGGTFIAGKFAVQDMHAFQIAFYRFALASLCFLPFLIREIRKTPFNLKLHLGYFVLGFLAIFSYHYLFFYSLTLTSAISAAFIVALNPIITTLLSSLFFRDESLNYFKLSGATIAFLGVLFVITSGNLNLMTHHSLNYGDILMFLAVFCWSASILLSRRLMRNSKALPLTCFSTFYGALIHLPFLYWKGFLGTFPQASLLTWGSVIYMAIFSTAIAYIFYYESIQKLGASFTALMLNLIPIWALFFAVLILGESLTVEKVVGVVLVLSGISFINLKSRSSLRNDIPCHSEE
ncbi:MAG: DMT family transporter [Deltaproteobacteria bacterium]|nr:DMT family transporter [Deltaproteobacteria bacterium]